MIPPWCSSALRAPHRRRPDRGGEGMTPIDRMTAATTRPSRPRRSVASTPRREMTLEEKLAQLYGVWVGASDDGGGDVAPHQHDMNDDVDLDDAAAARASASSPGRSAPRRSTPPLGARLARRAPSSASPRRTGSASRRSRTRSAWPASPPGARPPTRCRCRGAPPSTPSWSSEMARRIGDDMRAVGVHQGLAPVLDVVRDARWGRVEETIGEDPYLVGTVGTAYVRGLESAGRRRDAQALRRLLGLAGRPQPRAGRRSGARELADVLLPPFEMAVREGGARSVMNAYTDIDGVPSAADRAAAHRAAARRPGASTAPSSPTTSRVAFLQDAARRRPATWAEAAGAALDAPASTSSCPPSRRSASRCARAVEAGARRRGARRPRAAPRAAAEGRARPARRRLDAGAAGAARCRPRRPRGAARLGRPRLRRRTARSPADSPRRRSCCCATTARCRSRHRAAHRRDRPERRRPLRRCSAATRSRRTSACSTRASPLGHRASRPCSRRCAPSSPAAEIRYARGHERRRRRDRRASPRPAALAASADVVDRSRSATAPACSAAARAARAATRRRSSCPARSSSSSTRCSRPARRPCSTLLAGRPYALGRAATDAGRDRAGVLPGRGGRRGDRRRAQRPGEPERPAARERAGDRRRAADDATSRAPLGAGAPRCRTSTRPPAFPFGHGLGVHAVRVERRSTGDDAEIAVDGEADRARSRVRNTGDRAGTEVVQLYLHDPVASVVRPVQRLDRVHRASTSSPGERRRGALRGARPTSRRSPGATAARIVEPGELVLERRALERRPAVRAHGAADGRAARGRPHRGCIRADRRGIGRRARRTERAVGRYPIRCCPGATRPERVPGRDGFFLVTSTFEISRGCRCTARATSSTGSSRLRGAPAGTSSTCRPSGVGRPVRPDDPPPRRPVPRRLHAGARRRPAGALPRDGDGCRRARGRTRRGSTDVPGIDPSLTFDGGRVWLCGTRLAEPDRREEQTEVWLRELDPEYVRADRPEHVLWRGALVGARWAEGPHLFRRDGRWLLLAAEGGTERDHAVVVAYADEITGPYVGRPGQSAAHASRSRVAHRVRRRRSRRPRRRRRRAFLGGAARDPHGRRAPQPARASDLPRARRVGGGAPAVRAGRRAGARRGRGRMPAGPPDAAPAPRNAVPLVIADGRRAALGSRSSGTGCAAAVRGRPRSGRTARCASRAATRPIASAAWRSSAPACRRCGRACGCGSRSSAQRPGSRRDSCCATPRTPT